MNIFEDFNILKFKQKKPPTADSLETYKEIQQIHNLKKDPAFVKKYDRVRDTFKKVLNENGFDYPKDLIEYIIKNIDPIIIYLKKYHDRSRPNEIAKNYGIDLDVVDLSTAKTKAYPSGHSAQAVLIGLVLSDLYPQIRNQILREAEKISLSRNIGRLHYQSDSVVGKELGNELYKHYKNKRT
tara:strand:+ start:2658 stop:3206 length:549 start_codon:yes stop_codon:yes gene_type:complete